MHRPRLVLAWGTFLTAVFAGCVNLNVYVYFDQKKLDDAADKFVLDVRKEVLQEAESPAPEQPKKGSWLRSTDAGLFFAGLTTPRSAWADEDDKYVNVDTPAIRKIKDRMQERIRKLVRFLDGGNLGESNQASLEIRNEDGLSVKDKGEMRTLVKEENKDREELFREVAAANNAAASEMAKIRHAWARAFRKRTNRGWWIQKNNGDWVRKGEGDDEE